MAVTKLKGFNERRDGCYKAVCVTGIGKDTSVTRVSNVATTSNNASMREGVSVTRVSNIATTNHNVAQ